MVITIKFDALSLFSCSTTRCPQHTPAATRGVTVEDPFASLRFWQCTPWRRALPHSSRSVGVIDRLRSALHTRHAHELQQGKGMPWADIRRGSPPGDAQLAIRDTARAGYSRRCHGVRTRRNGRRRRHTANPSRTPLIKPCINDVAPEPRVGRPVRQPWWSLVSSGDLP